MYANEAITIRKTLRLSQFTKPLKLTIFIILFMILCLSFLEYNSYKTEENQTLALSIISTPKVNDIYFLDFRLLSNQLRPKEKYRIAKVVDVTGDIITLVYGKFFYQYQNAAYNSIKYGHLRYKNYFEPKRYDTPHKTIKNMYRNQAIYLAKRPIRNKLFGSLVGPDKIKESRDYLTYGKKENNKGEAFLKQQFSEINFKTAFELFKTLQIWAMLKGKLTLQKCT